MIDSIIAEGKTTEEAISNGLKQLNTTRDNVDIKVIEEHSKRFFSILAPRVVKVELKLKNKIEEKREYIVDDASLENAKQKTEKFLKELFSFDKNQPSIKIEIKDRCVYADIKGSNLGYLIGYRGEVLDSIQTLTSTVANKGSEEYVKILVDIENYRAKREKTLTGLAKSIANTVIREKKSITLEPMTPLERKIIHSALQNNDRVITNSIGEEPYRKVVISLKREQ